MDGLVLWRRLTSTDFRAMHGEASPHGRGGGARHISLVSEKESFPIRKFLRTKKDSVTIATQAWAGKHAAGTLTLSTKTERRNGEWRINDQFKHRHPAWRQEAGFPAKYKESNRLYILIFRVAGQFHVRSATQSELTQKNPSAPKGIRNARVGIASVSPAFLRHFDIPTKTRLEEFEEDAGTTADEPFDPASVEDGRKRVSADVVRRQGQRTFRRALLKAYNETCAITGCKLPWILEAAHITPYRGKATNATSNGILLRADIHTLFDLGLISVDPGRLRVRVSSLLAGTEYAALEGRPLNLPTTKSARPSSAALQEHFQSFQP